MTRNNEKEYFVIMVAPMQPNIKLLREYVGEGVDKCKVC
jgi:hypothetical protein